MQATMTYSQVKHVMIVILGLKGLCFTMVEATEH